MKLNQLSYLVAIEKYGTISRAAEALYLSQPSISVAVRELEEELGYPLLLRNNKGIAFTPEGLLVLEKARGILAAMDEIRHIRQKEQALSGRLRVGSTPHYCSSILLDVMLELERRYPEVSLLLEEEDSFSVTERVESGALEMGIVQVCDLEPKYWQQKLERRSVLFEELFQEEMCAAVCQGHPLAGREQVSQEELMQYTYGTYKKAMNIWVRQLMERYPRHERIITINDINPLRMVLMRTNSYTVVPRRSLPYGNVLYQEKMVPLTVEKTDWYSSVGLVYRAPEFTPLEQTVRKEILLRCREYQNM